MRILCHIFGCEMEDLEVAVAAVAGLGYMTGVSSLGKQLG